MNDTKNKRNTCLEIAKSIGSPNADAFSVRVVKISKSKIFFSANLSLSMT